MAHSNPPGEHVNFRVLHGGKFYKCSDQKIKYQMGHTKFMRDIDSDLVSKVVMEDMFTTDLGLSDIKEMWYLVPGKTINKGLHCIEKDLDAMEMLKNVGKDKWCHIYVIQGSEPTPIRLRCEEPIVKGHTWFSVSDDVPPLPLVSSALPKSPQIDNECAEESGVGDGLGVRDELLGSESSDNDEEFLLSDGENEEDYQFGGLADDVDPCNANVGESVGGSGYAGNNIQTSAEGGVSIGITGEPEVGNGDMVRVDEEGIIESDGFNSFTESDDDGGNQLRKYRKFNPMVDFSRKIVFERGMIFSSGEILRKALKQHAVECGADYYYLHNDKERISVLCPRKCDCPMVHQRKKCVCKVVRCGFKLYARQVQPDGTLQVKTLDQNHECGRQHRNQKVTSVWLADKYLEEYRVDPTWKLTAFIAAVQRDHKIDITYTQAWRARVRANVRTQGDCKEEYAKVWDYSTTIRKWNPGSSAYVKVCNDDPEKPIFERMYVCLHACKQGFMQGCRPIIGLDGCHLKGAFTGQILVAVGQDGNNCIFSITYAVVEAERKDSWSWFLDILLRDVGEFKPTFMSDRQKGLLEALTQHEIGIERTQVCVRHMYNNFKKQWPGQSFKDAIWAAARSFTKQDFDKHMDEIKHAAEGAYVYLMSQDPRTWSRHGFETSTKSDMLLNNICESFNSYLLPARDKSILSMAEWIRRQLMRRFVAKREAMKNYVHKFTPTARKLIEKSKVEGMTRCQALWGGEKTYEVTHFSLSYVVDIGKRTCTCMKWNSTGIPCPHATCAILKERLKVDDYVDDYYSVETYLKAYGGVIHAMPGQYQLEKADMVPPLPPKFVIQPGRPRKNARRREPGEEPLSKTKQIRISQKRHCKICGKEGHYKNKCSVALNSEGSMGKSTNTGKKRKYTKKLTPSENATTLATTAVHSETSHTQSTINQNASTMPSPAATSERVQPCIQDVCSQTIPAVTPLVDPELVLRRSPRHSGYAARSTDQPVASAPPLPRRSPRKRVKTSNQTATTAPPKKKGNTTSAANPFRRPRKAWK